MTNKTNAKQIKELMNEAYRLIAQEEGWEPKTPRDYMVLTWDKLKALEGIPNRVTRLEVNQSLLALFTTAAAAIAGYLGIRR